MIKSDTIEYKKLLMERVARRDFGRVINDLMNQIKPNTTKYHDLLVLSSNYYMLQRDQANGILSYADAVGENSKLAYAIINFIENIDESQIDKSKATIGYQNIDNRIAMMLFRLSFLLTNQYLNSIVEYIIPEEKLAARVESYLRELKFAEVDIEFKQTKLSEQEYVNIIYKLKILVNQKYPQYKHYFILGYRILELSQNSSPTRLPLLLKRTPLFPEGLLEKGLIEDASGIELAFKLDSYAKDTLHSSTSLNISPVFVDD